MRVCWGGGGGGGVSISQTFFKVYVYSFLVCKCDNSSCAVSPGSQEGATQ